MRTSTVHLRAFFGTLFALFIITAVLVLPELFKTAANSAAGNGDDYRTVSWVAELPNYDIRTDKKAFRQIEQFRLESNQSAAETADVRDGFVRGEETLKNSVPTLKIEYNEDIRIPEVIGTDVKQGKAFLTASSTAKRPEILTAFLKTNHELTGVAPVQVDALKLSADYKNPENDLSFVHFDQFIDGVPVFRGEVKAGFTKNLEIIRVINNLAPGLNYDSVSKDFDDPATAVSAAAGHINHELRPNERVKNAKDSTDLKAVFGSGDWATTAEKMYFPTEPGVAVPAWRVLIWLPVNAFYVIVDAERGTLLWRKNISEDQTEGATFNVYSNPNAMMNVADNPFPMTPGPTSPNGVQGSPISRTSISRIGNEAPYTFNNNGWITNGGNTTDGNAVQAGLDRDSTNGVDATNGVAIGTSRTFDFPINPGIPTNPVLNQGDSPLPGFAIAPSEVDATTNLITKAGHGFPNNARVQFTTTGTLPAPLTVGTTFFVVNSSQDQFSVATASGGIAIDLTTQGTGSHTLNTAPTPCSTVGTLPAMSNYQKAIVTQLFYIANWYHDETYRLGFTEQARNFQQDNFGRGGTAADRVSAEAQDCVGTNNANFSTPADGGRGRMQMFLWTAPTPDFDGSLDAEIVVHEMTHGLSNRLHGNGSGLSGLNMSRGMGEGWSDFYGHSMLSEPSDPIDGVYPTGGYAKYQSGAAGLNNYYYGVRRFPKAVMSFTGPNGRPHNPLTFEDVDQTKINTSDGAYAAAFSTASDGVHAAGEVWSSALWEIRAKYVTRLGWADGNRQALQYVTDGMKLAPLSPTFLSERDAIIAGILANGTTADLKEAWQGFATRGLGFNASIQNSGGSSADGSGTGLTRVTQAFDTPNLTQVPTFTVSDIHGDGDGFFEPGETLDITVPLSNATGEAINSVSMELVGGTSANYGTIAHTGSVSRTVQYTVPAGTACGAVLNLTFNVTSSIEPVSFQRVLATGSPVSTYAENFDGVSAPAFPAGWTVAASYVPMTFVNSTTFADSVPNAPFAADLPNCTTGVDCPNPNTLGGGTDLTSPSISITSSGAILTFRHRYNTEAGWDGGVLELSIGGGAFQDIISAGGTFLQDGYNGSMGVSSPNPLGGRSGWTGNSSGFITTSVRVPSSAAGQNVQFRWRMGADNNSAPAGGGWSIDNVQVAGQAACSFSVPSKARADFDGDGRTDLSVYRPSDNNWYINKSNGGIDVIGWGLPGDKIVPGRYDGDNRADFAVFRPSENRWYVLGSNGFTISTFNWGIAGDQPVPGDYDGDGRNDPAVFRASENRWYVQKTAGGIDVLEWGLTGDVRVPGDYNGDGKTDFAVFRNGQWHIALTGGGIVVQDWGVAGDKPVPADYDGDGKDDMAVFRSSDNRWYILKSLNGGIDVYEWGLAGDIPSPGDFDGDGRNEPAVFRNGTWYMRQSTSGIVIIGWGFAGDRPIPAGYIPE